MSIPNLDYWRKCTTCKKPIAFNQKYWICSVSTCNRIRTDLVFCDLKCFDAHVPVMNHRDAGAFEKIAPTAKAFQQQQQSQANIRLTQTQVQKEKQSQSTPAPSKGPASFDSRDSNSSPDGDEILVVVSKVKAYIRTVSGMNTSDAVMDVLSHYVRRVANSAIAGAKQASRQTVMDRDIR